MDEPEGTPGSSTASTSRAVSEPARDPLMHPVQLDHDESHHHVQADPLRIMLGECVAARFRLVPHLAKALSVPVPPLRRPGSAWAELPRPPAVGTAPAGHVRIGYARASTIRQSLDTQTDSLRAAGVTRISPDARDVQPLLALAAALADLRRLDEARKS